MLFLLSFNIVIINANTNTHKTIIKTNNVLDLHKIFKNTSKQDTTNMIVSQA